MRRTAEREPAAKSGPSAGERPDALILLFGAALALRLGLAFVTEARPLFPPHYYTDARLYDESARAVTRRWRGESVETTNLTPGKEVYTLGVASLYYGIAERPLVPKTVNALLGASTILLWWLAAASFGPGPRLVACALLAFWPSHIFFTSQNLKEAATLFLLAAAFLPFLLHWEGRPRKPTASIASLGAGALALIALGLFRPQLIAWSSAALLLGSWAHARKAVRENFTRRWAAALWVAAALLAYRPVMGALMKPLRAEDPARHARIFQGAELAGASPEEGAPRLSARWLGEFRKRRQQADREWSRLHAGREVATQILPDLELKSAWDVARHLPKLTFYALFMPFPGLYPNDGKPARVLAGLENVILLLIFLAAASALPRALRSPPALALAVFFLLAVPPNALVEFDLGSAARHRLQYFPFLFPFAAARLAPWLKRN